MTALTRDGIAALEGPELVKAVIDNVMSADIGIISYQWRPDRDINAAAEVIEKCIKPSWSWELVQQNEWWSVSFGSVAEKRYFRVADKSLCVAICRVALLAALELGPK